MLESVLSGEKTRTFRLKEPRFKVGSLQAVQCGYRDKAHARIKILSITKMQVGDTTLEQARQEGFTSVKAFIGYLFEINPKRGILPDTGGWSIEFKLQEGSDEDSTQMGRYVTGRTIRLRPC